MKNWLKNKLKNFVIQVLNNLPEEEKSKLYSKYKQSFTNTRYSKYRQLYNLDPTFRFNGEEILMYGNGKIEIAEGSYIGNYSTLQSGEGLCIQIGANCSISHNVRMYTTSNVVDQNFNTDAIKRKKTGNIEIGNGVWIGANVFINPGTKIGSNTIIGANSVVSGEIDSNAVYGGVPAKLIRTKKNL